MGWRAEPESTRLSIGGWCDALRSFGTPEDPLQTGGVQRRTPVSYGNRDATRGEKRKGVDVRLTSSRLRPAVLPLVLTIIGMTLAGCDVLGDLFGETPTPDAQDDGEDTGDDADETADCEASDLIGTWESEKIAMYQWIDDARGGAVDVGLSWYSRSWEHLADIALGSGLAPIEIVQFVFETDGTVRYRWGSEDVPLEGQEHFVGSWTLNGDDLSMRFPAGTNLSLLEEMTCATEGDRMVLTTYAESADMRAKYEYHLVRLAYDAGGGDMAGDAHAEVSLVAEYPLDGDAHDVSGNGHDGIVHGASPAMDRHGRSDGAMRFDGDDWIDLGSTLGYTEGDTVSVSCWVAVAHATSDYQTIVSAYDRDAVRGWLLAADYAYFEGLFRAQNHAASLNFKTATASDQLVPGRWYHLVAVIPGDGDYPLLYVDGVRVSGTTDRGSTTQSYFGGLPITIGRQSWPAERFFVGSIDDVRFYDTELTTDEIDSLLNESEDSDESTHQTNEREERR